MPVIAEHGYLLELLPSAFPFLNSGGLSKNDFCWMASSISITGFLMFLYVILTFFAAASAIVRVSVEQQVNT